MLPFARGDGKHGADYRPASQIYDPPNQRDGGVQTRLLRSEEMLHQNNVNVVEQHLSHEKNAGLQPFAKARGYHDGFFRQRLDASPTLGGARDVIGGNHGNRHCGYCPQHGAVLGGGE